MTNLENKNKEMLNQIFNEDCLEGMKRIEDKSIDMILCDLPYGTTRNKWDCIIDLDLLWFQYERIIKDNGAIVLTAQTPFDKVLGCSNLKMLKYEWIWEKHMATGHLNSKRMPMKAHENILVFYKKQPIYNPQMTLGQPYSREYKKNGLTENYNEFDRIGMLIENKGHRFPRSVVKINNSNKGSFHPTQKPVTLFEYLIKTYTNEGDTVLDNCIGSGTTAVACINTNRNYIGFELDSDYYRKSLDRISSKK